jgi:hypothetical protein
MYGETSGELKESARTLRIGLWAKGKEKGRELGDGGREGRQAVFDAEARAGVRGAALR